MTKEAKKIFIVLGLFALSGGIFYNFQELWMSSNNLSIKTISVVFSLCALLTVSVTFLCSNLIKPERLKKFTSILLFIKALIMLFLFFLNNTGLVILIKFLIMLDYVINTEIYACIYPMLALINKNDKTYAIKDLVYSASYNIGVLLTGFLLGKSIYNFSINYNIYCLIAGILIFLAFFMLKKVRLTQYLEETPNDNRTDLLQQLIKELKNDRISIVYLLFILTGQISYACVLSLTMTLLTNGLAYTPQTASTIVVFMSVTAVILGIIVLAKFTFKNNKISLTIKYVIRSALYVLAICLNNKIMFLIALMYPKIISESYSHITDAPYINRIENKYQLAFINLREMITYLGKAIGTLMCGIALSIGIRYNFIFAATFAIMQAVLSFYALKLRNMNNGEK